MINEKCLSAPDVALREITADDLLKVANIHVDSFPESALTKLGVESVRRYYLWQLNGSHEKVRAVAAYVKTDSVGFSFSGVFNGSTSGFISYNRNFLIRRVISRPWLLFNPLFRERLRSGIKILRNFTKKEQSKNSVIKRERPKSFGILAIAVSPNHQKFGIGKILMIDAENEAVKCGYDRMHLTVNPGNQKAIRFYENLNWKKLVNGDKWTGSMVKILV